MEVFFMKFTVNREELLAGIYTVEKFVPSKTPISLLSGIRFFASDDFMYLSATDLDIGIEYRFPGKIIEKGSAVLPSKIFSELVRKMPAGEVSFSLDENRVTIESGGFQMVMPCFDAQDFPEIAQAEVQPVMEFPQGLFKNNIKKVIYARAEDSVSRPYLTGVLIECREKTLHMVALDGFRVAWIWEKVEAGDFSVIVPGRALTEVSRIFSDGSENFKMYLGKNRVIFRTENTVISSRVLEGNFIDYEKVVDVEPGTTVLVDTEAISSAIERAHILAREGSKNNLIKFRITRDLLEVSAEAEIGSLSDKLPCKTDGEELTIAFNARFFIEALRSLDSPEVDLTFTTDTGPCIVRPRGVENHVNLILPVKLRSDEY
jgi:DNA polymerase-3 subunit beta